MRYKTIILGGGIAGLAAAAHSGRDVLLLEKEPEVGGLCRSFEVRGFVFDLAGHVLHFRTKEAQVFFERLLPGQMAWQSRRASVTVHGKTVAYPFQHSLHELPARMRRECEDGLRGLNKHKRAVANFLEWTLANFGRGIARHFMIPFNRKFWRRPLGSLDWQWAARVVPLACRKSCDRLGARAGRTGAGYNAVFAYPRSGGIAAVCVALRARVCGRVRLNAPCARIDLPRRTVFTHDGRSMRYGSLISTVPLPRLVAMTAGCPPQIRHAARALQTLPLHCFHVGVEGQLTTSDHWRYFPGKDASFFRLVFSSNICATAAPGGMSSLIVEVSGAEPPGEVKRNLPRELARLGIAPAGRARVLRCFHIPGGYPVPSVGAAQAAAAVRSFFSAHGVLTAGRFGRWEHSSIEDCFLDGIRAAEEACSNTGRIWNLSF